MNHLFYLYYFFEYAPNEIKKPILNLFAIYSASG
jgi:hypothetical protein